MQPQKTQKIDLNTDYPCPCRRRGQLTPITLTEALGCTRCQQIFVVEEGGFVIEQLSTTYPYKRSWRWNGHQWVMVHPVLAESYLPLVAFITVILLFFCLTLSLHSPVGSNLILWAIVLLLLGLSFLLVCLAYRR